MGIDWLLYIKTRADTFFKSAGFNLPACWVSTKFVALIVPSTGGISTPSIMSILGLGNGAWAEPEEELSDEASLRPFLLLPEAGGSLGRLVLCLGEGFRDGRDD